MSHAIKSAINELNAYSDENIYSIEKINFWLIENIELYEYSKLNWNNGSCYGELPCSHTLNNDKCTFMSIYESLKKVVDLQDSNVFFKKELEVYQSIKTNKTLLGNWIKQNEALVLSQFSSFELDYLDYSIDAHHLKIFILKFNEFDIYVNRMHFESTIAFLEIFNKLFCDNSIRSS